MDNQETAQVVGIGNQGVWVESMQQSACGACQAKQGCGQHTMSRLGRPVKLWVETNEAFNVGEQVRLSLPQGALAASALAMYGLPLIGLLVGAILGNQFGSDAYSLMGGGIGLVFGLLSARSLSYRFKAEWQPSIQRLY